LTPTVTVWHGDSIETMRELPDNSIDSIVTDPPYGLGFMGKAWDALPPGEEWAAECLRVLKPGGHLLAFGGSRTWHRLAVAVEDAGFEIRDSIAWLYGSGFPKSLDVSKAIDKAAGAEREVVGPSPYANRGASGMSAENGWNPGPLSNAERPGVTAPATDAAKAWEGWGTALKPAFEPIVMGRKPLAGTVAANVQAHGTGALNIDASRIGTGDDRVSGGATGKRVDADAGYMGGWADAEDGRQRPTGGRWPANVMLDEHTAALLDEQSGILKSGRIEAHHGSGGASKGIGTYAMRDRRGEDRSGSNYGDSGGASRFFYVAKAPKKERPVVDGVAHPTVKPLALMQHLIRLVTPVGGVVLDPFEGSGATLEACLIEGFAHIGIEREEDYLPLIAARIERQDPGQLIAA
jgi:site-specific DNA-methyltransferase (adenine-specific)